MINIPKMMKSTVILKLSKDQRILNFRSRKKQTQKEYLLMSSPTPLFYR